MLGEAKVPIGDDKVDSYKFKEIKAMPIPRIIEQANRLLEFEVRRHKSLGQSFNMNDPAFLAVTCSKNEHEIEYVWSFLRNSVFIMDSHYEEYQAEITLKGYLRYDELHARQPASTQGFVTMWFDDSMEDAYDKGFKVGISEAGYKPIRIDQKEHSNKIDDEIIAVLR